MASLSLFPMFLDPLGGGGTAGGGDIVVELLAEPEITLEAEITIEVVTESIDIQLEPEVDIELET